MQLFLKRKALGDLDQPVYKDSVLLKLYVHPNSEGAKTESIINNSLSISDRG